MDDQNNLIKPSQPAEMPDPNVTDTVQPAPVAMAEPAAMPSVQPEAVSMSPQPAEMSSAPQMPPQPVEATVQPSAAPAPVTPQPMAQDQPQVGMQNSMPVEAVKPKKSKKKLLIIIAVALFVIGGSVAAYFAMSGDDSTAKTSTTSSTASTESVQKSDANDEASDTKAPVEMNKIAQELEAFYNAKGFYPSKLSALVGLDETLFTDEYGEIYVYAPLNCENDECTRFTLAYEFYQDKAAADLDGSGILVERSLN